jgi:hypothetical protein
MAVPRLAILALVGLLLVPVMFVATRSGDEGSAPATQASPAKPRPAKARATEKARPAEKPAAKRATQGVPSRVARALERKRTLVLFFSDGKGADDAATAASVRALDRRAKGVSVFSDGLRDLGRYRRVVSGLGVSQGPAVVIVGPDAKADLVEGYIDTKTLLQQVADARR